MAWRRVMIRSMDAKGLFQEQAQRFDPDDCCREEFGQLVSKYFKDKLFFSLEQMRACLKCACKRPANGVALWWRSTRHSKARQKDSAAKVRPRLHFSGIAGHSSFRKSTSRLSRGQSMVYIVSMTL